MCYSSVSLLCFSDAEMFNYPQHFSISKMRLPLRINTMSSSNWCVCVYESGCPEIDWIAQSALEFVAIILPQSPKC